MKKLLTALYALALSAVAIAQTAQVVPQLGLDKTGTTRRVTVYDPTKAGADKMVPIGTLNASNVFTPAFTSGSNLKTVNGSSLLGSGDIGTIDVAHGGTGVTSSTGSGSNVLSTSPTLVTPALGTPSAAVLTNATGLPLTTGVAGTLPTANGGTGLGGATPYTANGVVYASGAGTLATGSGFVFNGSSVGIGSTSLTGTRLRIGGTVTDSTGFGALSSVVMGAAVTTSYSNFASAASLSAASFTLPGLRHFYAEQGTIGAGSTLTNQYGVFIDSTLVGATNNYGFYGNIPTGANRWNIFMAGTANNYVAGALGMGSTGLTGYTLRNALNVTGATSAFGITSEGAVQSDVTSAAYMFRSVPATSAASFTLGSLVHFQSIQGTIGAGSAITNQFGFAANANMIGAGSNYGFYGEIPSGSGRWNIYMPGTANNYLAGGLGIGSTALSASSLNVGRPITGNANSAGINVSAAIQSDVTSSALGIGTTLSTAAASFTLPQLRHFYAEQGTIGAGSTVSNQTGFEATGTLIGATNNSGFRALDTAAIGSGKTSMGFYSLVNTATGGGTTWQFYGGGTASSYLGGALGIGTTAVSGNGVNVRIQRTPTGSVNQYSIYNDSVVGTGATSEAATVLSAPSVAAGSQTLSFLRHYIALQGTIGAGATVTNQAGYYVDASLTGATNNFGFHGNIPAGANRYNLYMNGTADNYLAGPLLIGVTASPGQTLALARNPTGSVTYSHASAQGTIQSDVTNSMISFGSTLNTQAASFTLSTLRHFFADQGTIGAGSTVTTQVGYDVTANLVGATNNYGFRGSIPAGGNRYNLYMVGTAPNYFAGDIRLDKTITTAGTTGAATINKNAGSVNFAAAATSLVVTNDRVTVNSILQCTVAANDNTMKSVACVAGAGSFTMYANAAATAETRVNFLVVN